MPSIFPHVRSVLDVGGGEGALATTLLHAYPALRATVFDLAGPIAHARDIVAAAALDDRCECIAGDFFVDVPPADGIVVLKSVLHNWDDAKAGAILRTCRRAMQPEARLLILERVIAGGSAGADAALFDINMLVVAGGRERTESEYRALLSAAGFRLTRVIATASPLSVIEAIRTRAH
jgi:ubiquinone/menaquinone biosynthesis C-methylase UbiE